MLSSRREWELLMINSMEHFCPILQDLKLKSKPQKERIHFLSNLIKNDKADVRILEWAGFVALENQKWEMAEGIFSSLMERRDKILDLAGLAKALHKQSRQDEAKECYLTALDKITEPCVLLFIIYKSLGEIYLLKDDFPMAEEYYNKASTLNPSCESLVFHRAMIQLKEKNYAEAEQNFQIFLQSHLNHAKAWMGLALVRKALGDEELALSCLKRCLDFNPSNIRALNLEQKWQSPNVSAQSLTQELSNNLNFSA